MVCTQMANRLTFITFSSDRPGHPVTETNSRVKLLRLNWSLLICQPANTTGNSSVFLSCFLFLARPELAFQLSLQAIATGSLCIHIRIYSYINVDTIRAIHVIHVVHCIGYYQSFVMAGRLIQAINVPNIAWHRARCTRLLIGQYSVREASTRNRIVLHDTTIASTHRFTLLSILSPTSILCIPITRNENYTQLSHTSCILLLVPSASPKTEHYISKSIR